jgi:hypothetical protein
MAIGAMIAIRQARLNVPGDIAVIGFIMEPRWVVAIFGFLGAWNDLLGPLISLDSGEKLTLAISLGLKG